MFYRANTFIFIIFIICLSSSANAQTDDLKKINQQVIKLYQAGKYLEAIPIAKTYAEKAKERHGETPANMQLPSIIWRSFIKSRGSMRRRNRSIKDRLAIR